jgi:hypothetical protein
MAYARRFASIVVSAIMAATGPGSIARAQEGAAPAPPENVQATDKQWDGGEQIVLTWTRSPDDTDGNGVAFYKVYRTLTELTAAEREQGARPKETGRAIAEERGKAIATAKEEATKFIMGDEWDGDLGGIGPETLANIRESRARAARAAEEAEDERIAAERAAGEPRWKFVANVEADGAESYRFVVGDLARGENYFFRVLAVSPDRVDSAAAVTPAPIKPTRQLFDGSRFWLLIIVLIFCGAVVWYVEHARRGRPLKVRPIAGLEAIDEAVGRATEMGRSVLFVPGIQDMNDIQTIAGITILSRLAKTAAEYDAKVEVPTTRSLVMTTARETVQAAFLAAGRPDAYNEDLIYYVTDEQFGYVAYLSGMMVREKPAACVYMGAFFAESLILAETGNSIGAIQVAGTAMPAQLPFFVAACDYTLIGEEFFAASAYLSGSPEELGSLKGQDVGKVIVTALLIIGVVAATGATFFDSARLAGIVDFLKTTILT